MSEIEVLSKGFFNPGLSYFFCDGMGSYDMEPSARAGSFSPFLYTYVHVNGTKYGCTESLVAGSVGHIAVGTSRW